MNTTHTREDIGQKERLKETLCADNLSIRDYFAAKAMQGMLSAGEFYWSENVAFRAYEQADAMLAERNKT